MLEELLARAAPGGPKALNTKSEAAVLALSLHCLMVEDGFDAVIGDKERVHPGKLQPASDWNGRWPDLWLFKYRRKGYAHPFEMACSLQGQTGRMYVHVRELGNDTNIAQLGISVPNYIDNATKLHGDTWSGVVSNEEAMVQLFDDHIKSHLISSAVVAPRQARGKPRGLMTIVTCSAAVMAFVLYTRSR